MDVTATKRIPAEEATTLGKAGVAHKQVLTAEEMFFEKLENIPTPQFKGIQEAWVRLIEFAEHVSLDEFTILACRFLSVASSLFIHLGVELDLDTLSLLTKFLDHKKSVSGETAQKLLEVTHAFSEYPLHPLKKHHDIFKNSKITEKCFSSLRLALPIILQQGLGITDFNNHIKNTNVTEEAKVVAEKFVDFVMIANEEVFINFSLSVYQQILEQEKLHWDKVDHSFLLIKLENLLQERNPITISRFMELYNFIEATHVPELMEINMKLRNLLQVDNIDRFRSSIRYLTLKNIKTNTKNFNENDITTKIMACRSKVPTSPIPKNQKLLYMGLKCFNQEETFAALIYKLMRHICCLVIKHPQAVLRHDQQHGLAQLLNKANNLLFDHDSSAIDRLVILCETMSQLDKGHGDLTKVRIFLQKQIFAQYPSLTPTHLTDKGFKQSLVYHHLKRGYIPSRGIDKATRTTRDIIPFTMISEHLERHSKEDVKLKDKIINWFLTSIHRQQIRKELKISGFSQNLAGPTQTEFMGNWYFHTAG